MKKLLQGVIHHAIAACIVSLAGFCLYYAVSGIKASEIRIHVKSHSLNVIVEFGVPKK